MVSYTRKLKLRQLGDREPGIGCSIHAHSGFQIDRLPFALDNAVADLCRSLLELVLPVRVKDFLHANAAMGAMIGFEAGVQAAMSNALTVAVTRHLADHHRNPGSQFVRMYLVRILEMFSNPQVSGQNRKQVSRQRRHGVVGGNMVPLGKREHTQGDDQEEQGGLLHGGNLAGYFIRDRANAVGHYNESHDFIYR